MENIFHVIYSFTFESGETAKFDHTIDRDTLRVIPKGSSNPEWALLQPYRCTVCKLDSATDLYCPLACSMAGVVEYFGARSSWEEVYVTVETQERNYSKKTSLQQGLSSLSGLIMATSGCPVMEYLKPMAAFHLPFATVGETEYRTVSMYLVAQLKRQGRGLRADWKLSGLKSMYADVAEVNRTFAMRLASVVHNDANINAIVNLDCFAKAIPYAAGNILQELDPFFKAYLGGE